jgi:hypothetical protein
MGIELGLFLLFLAAGIGASGFAHAEVKRHARVKLDP